MPLEPISGVWFEGQDGNPYSHFLHKQRFRGIADTPPVEYYQPVIVPNSTKIAGRIWIEVGAITGGGTATSTLRFIDSNGIEWACWCDLDVAGPIANAINGRIWIRSNVGGDGLVRFIDGNGNKNKIKAIALAADISMLSGRVWVETNENNDGLSHLHYIVPQNNPPFVIENRTDSEKKIGGQGT